METSSLVNADRKARSVLFLKIIRDFKSNAMQFIAMMLLCFLGTWVFSGMDTSWRTFDKTIETYFTQNRLFDISVIDTQITQQDLSKLRHTVQGISPAYIRPRTMLEVKLDNTSDIVYAALYLFDGPMDVNMPYLKEGSLLSESDRRGCLVEEQFAKARGIKIGDSITFELQGLKFHFIVRGIILSPEFTCTIREVVQDPEHYGFVYANSCAFPSFPCNNVLVKFHNNIDIENAVSAIGEALPRAELLTRSTHRPAVTARYYPDLFQKLSILFPLLAMAVAAMILINTLKRLIEDERLNIGTLCSLGYNKRQIFGRYVWYAIIPSTIGSFAGFFIGRYTFPLILLPIVQNNVVLPVIISSDISAISCCVAFFSIAASVFICLLTFRQTIVETAASLLRPKPPKTGSRILLERYTLMWSKLSFNSKIVIRNLMRNKGRMFITIVGVLCCNMLIICTFALQSSVNGTIASNFGGTLQYDYRIKLKPDQAAPIQKYVAMADRKTVEGIMEVSITTGVKGKYRMCMLTVAEDNQKLICLGPDQTWIPLPSSGAYMSSNLAKILGVNKGQFIEFYRSEDSTPKMVQIVDFCDTNMTQGIYMSRNAWESLYSTPFYPTTLYLKDPTPEVLNSFACISETDTITSMNDQRTQAASQLDSASLAFTILSIVALSLAFVICYNMARLNFNERKRDYATLKVLGYFINEIRRIITSQAIITSLIGTLLGIAPGILLCDVILTMIEQDSISFVAIYKISDILLSSIITFLFTLLVEFLFTRRVQSIDMVEALKSVD